MSEPYSNLPANIGQAELPRVQRPEVVSLSLRFNITSDREFRRAERLDYSLQAYTP